MAKLEFAAAAMFTARVETAEISKATAVAGISMVVARAAVMSMKVAAVVVVEEISTAAEDAN